MESAYHCLELLLGTEHAHRELLEKKHAVSQSLGEDSVVLNLQAMADWVRGLW